MRDRYRVFGRVFTFFLALLFANAATGALAAAGSAKPGDHVVLLHGLARTSESMVPLEKALTAAGYRVLNLNYDSRRGSVEELSELVIGAALDLCQQQDAQRIHFVTHSLSGIMVRSYLSRHAIPNLGRVVMLAPPNQGSVLTERLDFFYRHFGPINGEAGWELGISPNSTPNKLGPATFPLGVIAGDHTMQFFASLLIPGRDDGRIAVERTKLAGMRDHIVVHASHPFIAKQPATIHQTLAFLREGKFDRGEADTAKTAVASY